MRQRPPYSKIGRRPPLDELWYAIAARGHDRYSIERAGYRAVWHGQKGWNGVAIFAKGVMPVLTRRGLPGDPDDTHSRYIEAAVDGILVGCLHLPNGNPAPGAKFDYKLGWFKRLQEYAAEFLELDVPALLVGDLNVMPTHAGW